MFLVILQDDIDIKNFQTTETPTINMIRFSKLTIAAMKNLNMNAMYSSFNVCFWLIFQGEFRNSTLLENLSNQLVQRSNKYYTRITFLVLLNVCVCVTILNATLQRVFWLSWKNKSGKWLHTLCNYVFHFYLQIKIFHQSIN